MTILKRLTALFLCLALAFALCACKEEESSGSKNKTDKKSDSADDDTDNSEIQDDDNGETGSSGGSEILIRDESVTLPPLTAPEETPQEVTDAYIYALQEGDWDTVNSRMAPYAFSAAGIGNIKPGGIMERIISAMTVEEQLLSDNGDGTYTLTLTVETIDFRGLLDSLPEQISSKEEAGAEMLRLADSAARSSFTGELIILRYSKDGPYYIEPQLSFVNAITGGLYDAYTEYVQEVAEQ